MTDPNVVGEPPIVDRLRHDIITGELTPGERLVELQLAARLGVGRGAIRSALAELEKEGLVERTVNRGATVRRVGLREAIEITEARQALESLCAAHAAKHATPDEGAELLRIRDDMRKAVAESNPFAYSALNGALHRRLCEISRHQVAAELVVNLRNRAANHPYQLAMQSGRMSVSLPQHEAIIGAIVAGDADAARSAMREHLESVVITLQHWSDRSVLT
jgi:DNA-binding GntR family transcriptional regulator